MRSVILLGAGCSRENAEMLGGLGIPILTTWQGVDRIYEDHPSFCGRPGVIGQRASNVICQKAERLYCFGARLDHSQINYKYETFAPRAKKIIYDIDPVELAKFPPDWETHLMDLQEPFTFTLEPDEPDDGWLRWCKDLYKSFRHELDCQYNGLDYVDSYAFVSKLSDVCREGEIIVPASSGQQSCVVMQAFKVKRDQRILLCNTTGAIGFEPMAIGAAIATGKRVIVISGEGGFFVNGQELEVVKRLGLNIKYFVFENGGYASVTIMQDLRFGLRVGADQGSNLTFPALKKFAAVWDFPYFEINDNLELDIIETVMNFDGAAIIRVKSSLESQLSGKVQASLKDNVFINDDLSDLTPKLPPGELERIMRE